jgi:hypothetical protein
LAGDRVVADVGLVADVTIAPIYLDEYGVRYRGWEYERTQTPWNDIIPFVKEEEGWRGQKPDTPDLVLELARTALLQTESAERDELLAVVRRISEEMRVVEERHLFSAYEHHGVNWTPAPVSVEVPLHAGVDISARPDPRQDVWEVRAQVSNRGTEVISQALIELSCETFSAWDGLVVPVGQVKPGQRVEGTVFVPLVPGVDLRRDEVTATLRADGRQELTLPPQVLDVNSSEVPRIRVNAVLRTEGENRVVQVRLRNLSATPIEGLEAYFEHPGDVDVELIDRAARIPRLGPREAKTLDLAVRLGEDAPEVLPLDLVVETDRYDELVDWPLLVPIDGTEIVVEAPKVVMRRAHPLSAPVGPMDIPFVATDDGQLTFLVAYVNGEKVAWAQGVKGKAEIVATADLHEGRNRIVAIAEDDQGVRSRYDLTIHGEANDVADEGDETP